MRLSILCLLAVGGAMAAAPLVVGDPEPMPPEIGGHDTHEPTPLHLFVPNVELRRSEIALDAASDGEQAPRQPDRDPPPDPVPAITDLLPAIVAAADDPEAGSALEALIEALATTIRRRADLPNNVRIWLVSAAGSLAAQRAVMAAVAMAGIQPGDQLLLAMADAGWPEATRCAALEALGGWGRADATVTERMLALLDQDWSTAPNGLGAGLLALAARARDGGRSAEWLLRLEARAAAANQAGAWLESLARSGHPGMADVALRYCAHADPATRAAALAVLGRTMDERSQATLTDAAADRDPMVRGMALAWLARHGDVAGRSVVAQAMRFDSDPALRAMLVGSMAHCPEDPSWSTVLALLANEDPAAEVRDLARQLLDPP